MSEICTQAIERLEKEKAAVKGAQRVNAVKNEVCETLLEFCKQNDEFAQAVVQGGEFYDCLLTVTKNVNSTISDLEAYRRAVAFYFPGADIRFNMTIDLCASVNGIENGNGSGQGIVVRLDDFF